MQSQEVLQKVASTSSGLTQVEAQRRLEQHGPTNAQQTRGHSAGGLPQTVQKPLIYILVAAVVAILVRDLRTPALSVLFLPSTPDR